jgi:hypothetical protein
MPRWRPRRLLVPTVNLAAALPPAVTSVLLARVAIAGWEAESMRSLLALDTRRRPLNILLTVEARAHIWPPDVLETIDMALRLKYVGKQIPSHWFQLAEFGLPRWQTHASALFSGDAGAKPHGGARDSQRAQRRELGRSVASFSISIRATSLVELVQQEPQFHIWLTRDPLVLDDAAAGAPQ